MTPLISVIVPVYKVERYIHRCVDSILSQTYQNLEIILVNDGSPDKCGQICEEYAQKDSRVIVIHRDNGGLSAARNSGIEACHGDYIGFVDSDDYIHPEMYEQLYKDICKHKTLMAFCHTDVIRNGTSDKNYYGKGSEKKTKSYVMHRALSESIWWAAWPKLYHKSLFDSIRFPEGRTNEDLAVMMYIYDRCDYIAINYNKLYFYCIREGSITTTSLNSSKFDIIDNTINIAKYMRIHHPEFENPVNGILLTHCLRLLIQLQEYVGDDLTDQGQKTLMTIRKRWPRFLTNPYISRTQRFLLVMVCIHPKFINLYKIIKKSLVSLKKGTS